MKCHETMLEIKLDRLLFKISITITLGIEHMHICIHEFIMKMLIVCEQIVVLFCSYES
jgi:hypothetical protein